jgi:hypothetical protein
MKRMIRVAIIGCWAINEGHAVAHPCMAASGTFHSQFYLFARRLCRMGANGVFGPMTSLGLLFAFTPDIANFRADALGRAGMREAS